MTGRFKLQSILKHAHNAIVNTTSICLLFGGILACSTSPTQSVAALPNADTIKKSDIFLNPPEVLQGGITFISIFLDSEPSEISGLFNGKSISFYPDGKTDSLIRYTAMVGVAEAVPAGVKDFLVKICLVSKGCHEKKASLKILSATFPSETLSVPPRTIEPNKEDQKKIMRDMQLLKKVYAMKTQTQLWKAPLVLPVQPFEITSGYGARRVYNGKTQSVHYGTDARAPTGTPIYSPLRGRVALAQHLFYTGHTVILDHGYGLFTVYAHLSKRKIKQGGIVEKGTVIGLSGATGRASGPHLHWGVNLHGARVDPVALINVFSNTTSQNNTVQ